MTDIKYGLDAIYNYINDTESAYIGRETLRSTFAVYDIMRSGIVGTKYKICCGVMTCMKCCSEFS